MDPKRLEQLEIKALALRKIADEVLDEVRAEKKARPPGSRKQTKIDTSADLLARILGGRSKPNSARKKKTT